MESHSSTTRIESSIVPSAAASSSFFSNDCMNRTKGIQLAFWAAFLGSFLGVFVRLLDFYPTALAFIGMIVLAATYSIVMGIRRINPFDRELLRQQGWKLFLRGFLNVTTTLLSIFALKVLPIGDAAVIGQTGPVYTSILAWLFLGEAMSIYLILCLTLTVGGTILVAAPELFSSSTAPPTVLTPSNISALNLIPFAPGKYDNWPLLERLAPQFDVDFGSGNNTVSSIAALQSAYDNQLFLAMCAALLSAFIAAVDNVLLRSMSAFVHSEVVIFYFAIEGSLLLFVPTIISGRFDIPLWGWQPVLIVTAGAVYFVDIFLSIQAYKYEQASVLSLMRCVYSVFAFVWQVLIFHQKPAATALIGTFLVFVGVALVAYGKFREMRSGTLPVEKGVTDDADGHVIARDPILSAETESLYSNDNNSFTTDRKRWWHSAADGVRHMQPLKFVGEQRQKLRARFFSSPAGSRHDRRLIPDEGISEHHNEARNPTSGSPQTPPTSYGTL